MVQGIAIFIFFGVLMGMYGDIKGLEGSEIYKGFFLFLGLTILIAIFTYYRIEIPMRRRIKNWGKKEKNNPVS